MINKDFLESLSPVEIQMVHQYIGVLFKDRIKDDTSNSIIVCGVHETSKWRTVADFKKQYDKVIAFNQEPLLAKQRTFMNIWMYKF